ncbi:transglutaminase domain-containing protein [Amycolatopsis thailandensis]|uniref:transglutaminase domain-containing protein n=1 Tax=Amycolatopsis thailandensis TaxID=589330 RepID=UPI0036262733
MLAPDPAPLTAAREADKRVVGTCRHFAVLGCALLRYRGIVARVHCGFTTPHDLRPGEFLTGGEAWRAYRRDEFDASRFGVDGTRDWGTAEIPANKVETLPWDEWGRMTDAYEGRPVRTTMPCSMSSRARVPPTILRTSPRFTVIRIYACRRA